MRPKMYERGGRRIAVWRAVCLLLLMLPSGTLVAEVAVKDVRLWSGLKEAQLFVSLSTVTQWQVFSLTRPDRVVIDVVGGVLTGSLPDSSGFPWIRGIRSGLPKPGVLRLVVDLEHGAEIEARLLPPTGQYGHRLLVSMKSMSEPENTTPVNQPAAYLVVIDPGHGGDDSGATGSRMTREKTIVLKIARRLARMIEFEPGMSHVLTRDKDYYVSLRSRRDLASKHNAMVFVSIHADAFTSQAARGVSVYALSRRGATSVLAARLAKVENAADLAGGIRLRDKPRDVAATMLDMSLDRQIKQSLKLGNAVLSELRGVGPLHSPYVEQAGFMVLKAPQVPSILVESGYITNPVEESRLRSVLYREQIAGAILRGIKAYCRSQPACPLPADRSIHTVQRGESLSLISARYSVTVDQLKLLNGMDNDRILSGQQLRLH